MPKKEISLLPQEEFEKKPLGKFLLWVLSVGRWIVIVTELIVILAFLSRFKLDRDLADLYEQIRAKQAIVASSTSFEQDFRSLQNQLTSIEKLTKSQPQAVKIIAAVATSTPQEIVLTNLSFKEKEISLSGVSLSEKALGSFLKGLSDSAFFQDITLGNVSKTKEGETGIRFSLTAKVKKGD